MSDLTINIDMDKKCDRCGKPGATDAGMCLKCATKLITGDTMKNDVIDLTLIGRRLEHLDGLCRVKRAAADDFREACKAIGQEARVDANVLSKFITARIAETSDKASKSAEQLSLLFTEVGL
jgi:hypothetical protein